MKQPRISLGKVIGSTIAISVVYLVSAVSQMQYGVVLGLLGLAITATIWMVVRILKDPWQTNKTFDDQFYQDRDDLRRCGKE